MVDIVDKSPLWMSARLNLALIGFFGIVVVYALRIDLSFGIVCMVNQTSANTANNHNYTESTIVRIINECPIDENSTQVNDQLLQREGEFEWSKNTQAMLLSSFFWGYALSQVLGGWLASRFGGKIVLGATVFAAALITLISPICARIHVAIFLVLRIMLGFAQGMTFPAFHTMWSHWSPPMERSLLTGMTYAGGQIGNVVTLPLSGVLCRYGFAGGWPSIFYVLGLLAMVWVFIWYLFVADSPSVHPKINRREQLYIETSLANEMRNDDKVHVAVPWRRVLTSLPVWACIVGHFAGDFGAYMMLTCLPTFMNDVLKFEMTSLGFIASVPYIAYFLCINIGGFLADTVRKAHWLNTLNTRRMAMIIALGSQALFLVISGYCGCGQETLVMILITVGVGLSGFQYAGYIVNYLDIAPAFAGPILGIGNTISCLAGLSPMLMGLITTEGTRQQWQTVFWLTAGILVFGTIFFCLFASGDVQQWAKIDADERELETLHSGPTKTDENTEKVIVD